MFPARSRPVGAVRLDTLVVTIGGAPGIGELRDRPAGGAQHHHGGIDIPRLADRRSTRQEAAAYTSTGSSCSRKRAMSRSWIIMSRNSPPEVAMYAGGGGAGSRLMIVSESRAGRSHPPEPVAAGRGNSDRSVG